MDQGHASALDQVAVDQKRKENSETDNKVTSTTRKLPVHSQIKPPTPCASFKRPALTPLTGINVTSDMTSKRIRLDMSSSSLGASKLDKSKSKSVIGLSIDPAKSKMPQRVAPAHHQNTGNSLKPALQKAPSLNCLAPAKTAKISAPTTKSGKRPAWDLKGRMQDYDDALKEIQIQNAELLKTTDVYNQRLILLESTNCKLLDEVKLKENVSEEKSNKLEAIQRQLREKTADFVNAMEENSALKSKLHKLQSDMSTTEEVNINLQKTIGTMTATEVHLRSELARLQLQLDNLSSVKTDLEASLLSAENRISSLEESILERNTTIREHEELRRRLHNTIQDLKGNIRVFCRVRPPLPNESCKLTTLTCTDNDQRLLEISKCTTDEGTKGHGKVSSKSTFTFDRVFDSNADQSAVFEEVSQLVQSALDGYNVCIFAYGQTGSGKTFTMEGPQNGNSDQRGMISRTVEQIFDTVQSLESQGWQYSMDATYVEIYNESIRDLLGNHQETKLKHEIKMCDTKNTEVYVSNLCSVNIKSKEQVSHLLSRAQRNRAVASTQCNERSSRSHSIFRLLLSGKNSETSVACQGTLNLVDLAGSERLKESQSEGDRLKETKSINKSLSNLSNVITSLANKSEHIPYRNSKLTHLLMNSLGGNSKTLMFVNISPCDENINESMNSLRFAATVNQCDIGIARKRPVK